MHKDKKGKIFASLTEVKNKTGDIFALVDEHGEITLTSYNKPRYKISKLSVEDRLGITEQKTKVSKLKEEPAAPEPKAELPPEDKKPDELVANEDDTEVEPEDENPDALVANEDDNEVEPEDKDPDSIVTEEETVPEKGIEPLHEKDEEKISEKKEELKSESASILADQETETTEDNSEHMEIKAWDRHGKKEKSLLGRILKPLQ